MIKIIRRLSGLLGRYRKETFWAIPIMILGVITELLMPIMMARIIDVGIPNQDLSYILRTGAIMIGLGIASMGFGILNMYLSSVAAQGFGMNVRQAVYAKVTSFAYNDIDRFSTASLVTRMTNDTTLLQNTFMMALRMMVRAPFMMVFAIILTVGIHARLARILLVALPVLSVGIYLIMTRAHRLFSILQKKIDALTGTVQENLIAIRVVKAFVREGHEKTKFAGSNDELMKAAVKAGSLVITMGPLMMLIMNMATVSVLWLGAGYVSDGSLTTGQLMSFIQYNAQILMSLMMISMVFLMASRARASGTRILEVLETEPTIRDETDAAAGDEEGGKTVRTGHIEFDNVSFRYLATGTGDDVLSGLNFTAEPGEVVGIVGGTGTGKTSLVNLVPRLYDVTQGSVRVGGEDVRAYPLRTLRESIGVVLQNNVLFSGTIRENLLWGREDATDEKIIRAARHAQAHDFIESFPDGYDTLIGQSGVNLSGGQKQRLCIARALLRNPKILILDDSTSAVDSDTEQAIRKAFREELHGMTILIIAQRISSVSWADRILVLDDGKLVGNGTHQNLLEDCPVYQEIVQSQIEGGVA